MAGLAVVHGVAVAVLLIDGSRATVLAYTGVVLVIAAPLAFTRARGFEVACGVAAALVMAGGLLLAFGGGVLFWPAALPLGLATSTVAGRRPVLVLTAVALAIPWAVLGIIRLS